MRLPLFLVLCWTVLSATAATDQEWADAQVSARLIDRLIGEAQTEAGVRPSHTATDAEFLRRATLDLTGAVPEADLVENFLQGERPDRRQLLIDHLMQTEGYREGWALQWSIWLLGRERPEVRVDRLSFRDWVEEEVIGANMPHDQFVEELLTATGRSDDEGETNYLLQFTRAPENAAGQVVRNFTGQQIQCAQCHDHKFEDFSQEQFWEVVAFFEQMRGVPIRDENGRPTASQLSDIPPRAVQRVRTNGNGQRVGGFTTIQDTETVVVPTYMDGTEYPRRTTRDLRAALVEEITDPEDLQFARATVNRLWAHFFGRGFVEPIDDFRPSNPVAFPELLELLAQDFVEHGYDREHLIRSIMMSETYQRSSLPAGANMGNEDLYTHARLRPLTPEQLFNSLVVVSGFDPSVRPEPEGGAMARERPDPRQLRERLLTQFIFTHSSDELEETSVFEGTIPLTLFMMNNRVIARGTNAQVGTSVAAIMEEHPEPAERVDQIYLTVLGRFPTEAERQIAIDHLAEAGPQPYRQRSQTEDLVWALLNTSEFLFNH